MIAIDCYCDGNEFEIVRKGATPKSSLPLADDQMKARVAAFLRCSSLEDYAAKALGGEA